MPIAAIYASLAALLLLGLSIRVIRLRREYRVGVGSGGQQALSLAIRAQANFTEYAPLILLLLALAESLGAPAWLLHAAGILLLASRVVHAIGLSGSPGRSPGRFYGTLLSFLLLLGLAALNLALALVASAG